MELTKTAEDVARIAARLSKVGGADEYAHAELIAFTFGLPAMDALTMIRVSRRAYEATMFTTPVVNAANAAAESVKS